MTNRKELIGIIRNKKLDKVKNKKSEHYGNQYWRLTVEIESEEIKEILVFKEWLEQESIWQEIEKWELKSDFDKRYLFKVQRKPGAGQTFRLIDWELLDNAQSLSKARKIIKDYSAKQILKENGKKK